MIQFKRLMDSYKSAESWKIGTGAGQGAQITQAAQAGADDDDERTLEERVADAAKTCDRESPLFSRVAE
jgi:hypothetical protein